MSDYNISAFKEAGGYRGELVSCYCYMISLELMLKKLISNNLPDYSGALGHDIPKMIRLMVHVNREKAQVYRGLERKFSSSLSDLSCTDQSGVVVRVPQHNYPYIRYLAHYSDHGGEGVDESKLSELKKVVRRVYISLEKEV